MWYIKGGKHRRPLDRGPKVITISVALVLFVGSFVVLAASPEPAAKQHTSAPAPEWTPPAGDDDLEVDEVPDTSTLDQRQRPTRKARTIPPPPPPVATTVTQTPSPAATSTGTTTRPPSSPPTPPPPTVSEPPSAPPPVSPPDVTPETPEPPSPELPDPPPPEETTQAPIDAPVDAPVDTPVSETPSEEVTP